MERKMKTLTITKEITMKTNTIKVIELPENKIERVISPVPCAGETHLSSNFWATLIALLLTSTILSGCSGTNKEKNSEGNSGLLALASIASQNKNSAVSNSNREMYNGFADIPASIYKPVGISQTSSSTQRTLATSDYRFVNSTNTSSVAVVYDLVRTTAGSTRDIAKSIGDIIQVLEPISVLTARTGSDRWGGVASKYKYQASSILAGGKKLEIWWNSSTAPYNSNKALELEFTGSSTGSNSGFVFVRFLSSTSATSLSKAYIKFDYNISTNVRTMVVILQDIGANYTDNAHFFVQEISGVTSIDGAYTVKGYNANSAGTATGVTAAGRAYVFSAIGDANKSVIRAAFPLTTDNTSAIYGNTILGNIGQVWTNFILANTQTVATLNSINLPACNNSNITSTNASGGNPTTLIASISVANLKTCLDAIITAQSSTDSVKDVYFLTNIKNPAYFTVTGGAVSLHGVESLDVTDTNKSAFDALENNSTFLNSTRTASNTTYAANLDAVNVAAINLFTGTSIPKGTSATNLTNLNAQWGNGTPGTGTSSATAGTNTVNGTVDNTAPF